jgi:hypothetical protein
MGLGRRHQLSYANTVAGAFADQSGGGVLVAVAGGCGHGQPQSMPGRCRP